MVNSVSICIKILVDKIATGLGLIPMTKVVHNNSLFVRRARAEEISNGVYVKIKATRNRFSRYGTYSVLFEGGGKRAEDKLDGSFEDIFMGFQRGKEDVKARISLLREAARAIDDPKKGYDILSDSEKMVLVALQEAPQPRTAYDIGTIAQMPLGNVHRAILRALDGGLIEACGKGPSLVNGKQADRYKLTELGASYLEACR